MHECVCVYIYIFIYSVKKGPEDTWFQRIKIGHLFKLIVHSLTSQQPTECLKHSLDKFVQVSVPINIGKPVKSHTNSSSNKFTSINLENWLKNPIHEILLKQKQVIPCILSKEPPWSNPGTAGQQCKFGFLRFNLLERQTYREERKIFHPLIYSQSRHNSRSWADLKPGARS